MTHIVQHEPDYLKKVLECQPNTLMNNMTLVDLEMCMRNEVNNGFANAQLSPFFEGPFIGDVAMSDSQVSAMTDVVDTNLRSNPIQYFVPHVEKQNTIDGRDSVPILERAAILDIINNDAMRDPRDTSSPESENDLNPDLVVSEVVSVLANEYNIPSQDAHTPRDKKNGML